MKAAAIHEILSLIVHDGTRSLAEERRQAAVDFYHSLYREAASSYHAGRDALAGLLSDS